jgi:5-dehydro-2-deoxygluconokinase
LLIEIIACKHGVIVVRTVADVLAHLYSLGIRPDWWKLEPQNDAAAWRAIEEVIAACDPHCRGVVMLGLEAPEDELARAFAAAAESSIVRGFAIGRTIFGDVAESWLAGRTTDDEAVSAMAGTFRRLTEAWDHAMAPRPAA